MNNGMPLFWVLLLLAAGQMCWSQAIPVTISQQEQAYTLQRNGEPYFIKGAGGPGQWDYLVKIGGNSVRTWSVKNAQAVLDSAQAHGLTVMLGLWLQHERHGFDYSDTAAVARQKARFTRVVKRFKDHPALLMWGIGNEVDLFYENEAVWDAVQDIAALIQRLDPHHPTTTITAGLDPAEVKLIQEKAPAIDIYGINTYGAIDQVATDLKRYGWEGPYLIAEWGPNGHWEVDTLPWGAPLEQTSSAKERDYRQRYRYIARDSQRCLGSYVFLWGQKQEVTSTWYGLFTEWGAPTEPLDALQEAWLGAAPPQPAPSLEALYLNGRPGKDTVLLTQGQRYAAHAEIKPGTRQNLKIEWRVYPESEAESEGGDYQPPLKEIKGVVKALKPGKATLHAAIPPGAYRLFVYAVDTTGKTAYANLPFRVKKDKP